MDADGPGPVLHTWHGRVAFHDTDAAGLVHFSRVLVWMECCEHAFLRACGVPVLEESASGRRGWPRVHVACDYRAPLRLEETFDIDLHCPERGKRSLTWVGICRRDGVPVATARSTVVHAVLSSDPAQPPDVLPLPAALLARLPAAPPLPEETA